MDGELIITRIYTAYDGSFDLGTIRRRHIPRHCNGFVYFVYGGAEYFFDGYSFAADSKSFILLAKDSCYDIKIKEKSKYICVDFELENGGKPLKSEIFENISPLIKNEFFKLTLLWVRKASSAEKLACLYGIYSEAVRSKEKEYSREHRTITEIRAIIAERYTDPTFSVKSIHESVRLSETHLRRIFKNAFNTSPIKYINSLRLERAKNLLSDSNCAISEVAYSSGFSDPYYFSRFFKSEIGISPSEYRRMNS